MKSVNIMNLGILLIILSIGVSLTSFAQQTEEQKQNEAELHMQTKTEETKGDTYQGQITSINHEANKNRKVSGNIRLVVKDDQLHINVEASGLEPGTMYLQHLHGSKEGDDVQCLDSKEDANNDEVVDITEAYGVAGVTMIPLHDNPSGFEIKTETYPTADADGKIYYEQSVSLQELREAFMDKFEWNELDFTRFTYLIHGVEKDAVPGSAKSVKGIPAHVTLPIGCAKITQ